jgi:hypothetical protein
MTRSRGVWLVSYKAATGKARLTYEESIPDALAYGWIDSLNKPLDDERTGLLFTPRKPGSGWSRTNKVRIARLLKEGRMQPAGLAKIAAAKREGVVDATRQRRGDAGPPTICDARWRGGNAEVRGAHTRAQERTPADARDGEETGDACEADPDIVRVVRSPEAAPTA